MYAIWNGIWNGKKKLFKIQGCFFLVSPPFSVMDWVLLRFLPSNYKLLLSSLRGTSALHLNEATRIIDGSNELIVEFLFALVLFLDSTQHWPFKNPKQIFFFGSNKRMTCKSNSNAKPTPGQHHSSFHLPLHSNAGLVQSVEKTRVQCGEIVP